MHHLDEALSRDPRVVATSEGAEVRVRLAHQAALKQDAAVRRAHFLNKQKHCLHNFFYILHLTLGM